MKQLNRFFNYKLIMLLIILSGCQSEPLTSVNSFDGLSIDFDNEGKGEPAIILVHGWSNTRTIWDAQIAYFSEKYQVIAPDLPGFGKSGNNRSEWTMASYGEDISTIIKQLNLKKVVLVGFSLGASVVIEAANKVPDQVIGVVLVDDLKEVEMQIPPQMGHYLDSLYMDFVTNPTKEKLMAGGFFKNNSDSAYNRIVEILDGASHIGWRESIAGYINWQNDHCLDAIKEVKAPIVAINSDLQPTNVEAFQKYVPDFKVNIVKNVGHLIMWDNEEEFNRLLEESIREFTKK